MKPCIKCGQPFETNRQARTICDTCHAKYSFKHEKIKCCICGKSYIVLYKHLRSKHNMTKSDYMIKFPGQPLQSSTLSDAIIAGVPDMPRNNFCIQCGTMFLPHASITLCVNCYEKKIITDRPIECMICHRRFNEINEPHLMTHNTTITQYKQQFPNQPLYTQSVFKNRIDGYNKRRGTESLINVRKEQLTKLGVNWQMQGDTIVYGKYEEYVTSDWFAKTDTIVKHFLDVRKRGGIPVITATKDYKTYCATIGIYDHFKVLDIIYKIRYLPIIKQQLGEKNV